MGKDKASMTKGKHLIWGLLEEEDDLAGWVVNGERRHTGRQGELVPRSHVGLIMIILYCS
jgi:hypothetical protein